MSYRGPASWFERLLSKQRGERSSKPVLADN